jgi:hypothetical protein
MNWKGRELNTIGDLMTHGIDKCDTPEEAQEFMRLYEAENPHARDNIGYLAGYYSTEKKHQIFEWFGVHHPIFGILDPTPEQALGAGMKLAERSKRGSPAT